MVLDVNAGNAPFATVFYREQVGMQVVGHGDDREQQYHDADHRGSDKPNTLRRLLDLNVLQQCDGASNRQSKPQQVEE